MSQHESLESLRRSTDELRSSATSFAAGLATESEFVDALLTLDSHRLQPFGLTLSVSDTIDGWLAVMMKHRGTGKLWVAFEFLPGTNRLRRFGNLSQYAPTQRPDFRHPAEAHFLPAGGLF
jgi:hypothetical protein